MAKQLGVKHERTKRTDIRLASNNYNFSITCLILICVVVQMRKAIPRAIRNQVVEEANKCCHYCGKKITSKRGRQLDHKIPYDESDPNTNSKSNLVLSCKICNTAKATTPYSVFILKRWKYARKMLATLEQRLLELK